MQNITQIKVHTLTKICFGFFVAMLFLFISAQNVHADGTIAVKVLGIFAPGPVVGGTSTGFTDGTIVSVKVKDASGVVVGSANVPIQSDNIGPQNVPATFIYGNRYVVESQVLNPFQEVIASSTSDTFYAVGVSSVQFHNAVPTGIQVNLTSFGGDPSHDFGLLPVGEPGRMARLYYKPLPQNIFGELLYQFLPDSYLDFPFGVGNPPGETINQILLGLTPHTTYAYKVAISPTDVDENGQNDNYQTFIIPHPDESDFIYSDTAGPLVYGGTNGALPTFSTPDVMGGGWTYTGGQDGTNGGSNTNGNGNNGQPIISPDIDVHVIKFAESANFQVTISDEMPVDYTTTLILSEIGGNVVNGSGTPVATGPGTFSVTVSDLTPNTTYRYKFESRPASGTVTVLHFQDFSWYFKTEAAGTTVGVDATSEQHTATASTSFIPLYGSGGLVNCNGGTECDFNALMELANEVIGFLIFTLALPLAAIAFAYAGFLFLTSGASTENRTKAKGIFTTVFIGLVLAMAAWLIVYTILSSLLRDISPSAGWSWLSQIGGN